MGGFTPNGECDALGDSGNQAGAATQIAMVRLTSTLPAGNRALITAVRTGSGSLKLISWGLLGDGTFTRLGDSGNQAGEVSFIAASSLGVNLNVIVTAVLFTL